MLDIARIDSITLSPKPLIQRIIAGSVLTPNYKIPPRVTIDFEHVERLPPGPVIYAMNHTDRYNYWPFQYTLWRRMDRFTATWVKGKYYEHPVLAKFMEWTNNIPTVSRGYIIARDVLSTLGRRTSNDEYKALRALVNQEEEALDPAIEANLGDLFERPRAILGRPFEPSRETWPEAIRATFRRMTDRFVSLNEEAHRSGLDIIIFPQGTRSKHLSQGHIGIAQIALHLKATIVPVGCNGCDKVYPGNSPWAKSGHVVYRFGEPIPFSESQAFAPKTPFTPFLAEDEERHRENFRGLTDIIMDRINDLLDPAYQYSANKESDGESGSKRFI